MKGAIGEIDPLIACSLDWGDEVATVHFLVSKTPPIRNQVWEELESE